MKNGTTNLNGNKTMTVSKVASNRTYEFFLGGDDREMREIKKIAESHRHLVHDKSLSWGAKTSDYKDKLSHIVTHNRKFLFSYDMSMAEARGRGAFDHVPIIGVTIELVRDYEPGRWQDSTWPLLNCSCDFYAIDHHGDRAGEPPAIIQVCSLLNIAPTREQNLIGAMDAGYVYGLQSIGASQQEIAEFLGATPGTIGEMLQETENFPEVVITEAERAISEAEEIDDMIIVRCNHNTTAPICSRLIDQQAEQNLLILSEWEEDGKKKTEANYYGKGDAVRKIADKIGCGWTGGAGLMPPTKAAREYWTQYGGTVPNNAFFGCSGKHPGEVLKVVLSML